MLTEAECRSGFINPPMGCAFLRRFSPYCRMVEVSQDKPQAYFTIGESFRNPAILTFSDIRAYLELRRKGSEVLIATYHVWRRDENGAIGFYFDDLLFNQSPGYFIGDIFLNCCYCFSVQLRIVPCEAVVLDCYTLPVMEASNKVVCQSIGSGSIGGIACTPVPAEEVGCGPVPPYFPIDNPPIPPEPPLPPVKTCIVSKPIGAGTIG